MAFPNPRVRRRRSVVLHSFLSCALLLGMTAVPLILVSCSGDSADEDLDEVKTPKKRKRSSRSSSKTSSSRKSGSSSSSGRTKSSDAPKSSTRRSRGGSSDLAYDVKKLLEEARSSGASRAFSGDYKSAVRYFQQGEDAEDDGEYSLAEKRFERAKTYVERMLSEHKKFQKEVEEAQAELAKIEEQKKKADEDGIAELAGIDYEDAVAELERAKEAIADATPASIGDVKGAVDTAKGYLEDAIAMAERNKLIRDRAENEKAAMLGYKERAKESGADVKAMTEWLQGEQAERNADGFVAQGNFQEAVTTYQLASQTYIRALQRTVSAEQMKDIMARAAEERKEREARELALREKELETQKEIEERKAAAIEALRKDRQGGGTTYVPPTGGSVGTGDAEAEMRRQMNAVKLNSLVSELNASTYRQDLDAEDEEFLRQHYTKLSKALSYDPDTGVAYINYTNSKVMQSDQVSDRRVAALRKKNFLRFVDRMMEGSDEAQSFEANTQGYFYVKVPFRFRVRVTWDMAIGTMDANGSFNCIIMYDPIKKSSYLTDWIHWKYSSRGGRPKTLQVFPEKKFQGSANYWFDKTRNVPMMVEFIMPGNPIQSDSPTTEDIEASAKLVCSYDAGGGPDQKTNVFVSDSPLKGGGWVGFRWSRVKYKVKKLQIAGILDKRLAVLQLRKMTGIKKKGKAEEPETTTKADEPEEKPEEEKEQPKRITDPKDGFDF